MKMGKVGKEEKKEKKSEKGATIQQGGQEMQYVYDAAVSALFKSSH